MQPLGDLPGGSFSSQALAESADGAVVVGNSSSAAGFEAFRWTAAGGMQPLGDLPGGSFNSMALGVSADGSVIVGESSTALGQEAFIWDSTNGMRRLQDVLVNDFGQDLTGWVLVTARGISDDGRFVVGQGSSPSGDEAWIAPLPNQPPVADAGADQSVLVGETAQLDGSNSSDPDGNPLTFSWTITAQPAGSTASLSDPTAVAPTLVADLDGTYQIQLIVNDGTLSSAADQLTITAAAPGLATTFTGLGDLAGGSFSSQALGVSSDGTFVVGLSQSGSGLEAFRWTFGAGMQGLGDLNGGTFLSLALDVSDASAIVGKGTSAAGPEAFRWVSGGGMAGLGDLPAGSFSSEAAGVSVDGSVVVGLGFSGVGVEAFRWTAAGGMQPLGDLPGGSFSSEARATTADGSVVVGVSITASGQDLTGWSLSIAEGISDNGNFVVGWGTSPLGTEAWIAPLPNQPPVADAGADQSVLVGETAQLDGSNSSDPDGNPLTFSWTVTSKPAGSTATLSDPAAVDPTLVADLDGTYQIQLIVDDGTLSSTLDQVTITGLSPTGATQNQVDALEDIIDANPGTSLADKLEDAVDKLQTVLDEFNKSPPDNQAALGNLEGAIGELEAAIDEGLDPAEGAELMDQLLAIARKTAVDALDQAIALGGDPGEISDAQQALSEGDALRTSSAFKDAANKYKDALSKAESALPSSKRIAAGSAVAYDFELKQSYPNPSNPEVTIPYQLAQASDVVIRIYDVRGGLVRTFEIGQRMPGSHVMLWDGRDGRGAFNATRRLLILR